MKLLQVLTFLAALASARFAMSDDGKSKDLAALQGTWTPSRSEVAGKSLPDEVEKSLVLTIKDDKYVVTIGDKKDEGTLKLNAAVTPMTMHITGTDGPNKAKTIPAIYAVDGDTLTACYDLSGQKCPTEFKTAEGSPWLLITYQRKKP